MKKILALAVTLLLALACSLPALAVPVDADGNYFTEVTQPPEVSQPSGEPAADPAADGDVTPAAPVSEEERKLQQQQEQQQVIDQARAKAEREAARDAILALAETDENILAVKLGEKSAKDLILVAIAEGHEKEYAKRFVEQYGAFVVVVNDVELADDAAPVRGGALELVNESAILPANPGTSSLWLWLIVGLAVCGMASAVVLRHRRSPVLVTADGQVVTRRAAVSRKAAIASVKESETAPGAKVLDAIKRKIGGK